MFEFELPLSKKKVTWRPLTVKQQLDLGVLYRADAQKLYLQTALYGARIIQFEEKQLSSGVSLSEIGAWDEVDYTAFTEHVDGMEADRHRQYRKRAPGEVGPVGYVEKALMDVRLAYGALDKALTDALEWARAAEAQQSGPLK